MSKLGEPSSPERLAHKRALRKASPHDRERMIAEHAERQERARREERERVTAERLAVIDEVVEAGGTILDVAQRLDLLPAGVVNWAQNAGVRRSELWKRLDKTGYSHRSGARGGLTADANIDPADLPPTPQRRRQDRLDDIEWMVSWGASDVEVSARTGQSLNTLERYLCRNGRWDLWAKMTKYRALAAHPEREGVTP